MTVIVVGERPLPTRVHPPTQRCCQTWTARCTCQSSLNEHVNKLLQQGERRGRREGEKVGEVPGVNWGDLM